MFLLNSRLDLFSATTSVALLLPKLRSHFAEFLNNGYLAHLRILSSPTCVGLRYGYLASSLAAFLASVDSVASILIFCPHHASALSGKRTSLSPQPRRLDGLYHQPAQPILLCHCLGFIACKIVQEYQPVVHRLRPSSPRLRSRLTLGGRAFPRKP